MSTPAASTLPTAHLPGRPVAIITGAGSGIGKSVANLLASRGMNLALLGRTASSLKLVQEQLALQHPAPFEARIFPMDVSDPAACQQVIQQADQHWGRIDALINVAGIAPSVTIDAIDVHTWQQIIAINLSGPFYMMYSAWPIFRRQGGGVVVNISSLAARDPFDGFAAYGAAKAGLNLLSLSAAREARSFGGRVHVIAPGAVETGLLRSLFSEDQIPAQAALSPDEVASAVASCLFGPLAHTSGEVIWLHR